MSLSVLAIAFSFVLFGQTGIIANKSHSGTQITHSSTDLDHFGIDEPSSYLREIEYVGSCCVIMRTEWEYSKEMTIDTICDDPFMQKLSYDPKLLKEYYPDYVRFIGFGKYKKDQRNLDQNGVDPSLIWFYVILVAGFVAFLFFPNLNILKK
ncbi:MAG: hypothetical protein ACI837_000099 [Crocinitomicaceae bacterium]